MSRKTKRDWLIGGVQLLAEVGNQGLTIDALCQHLGVTKGSFYHHFSGYEDFKLNLLAFYEEEGTLDIIETLADLETPEEKLRGLIDIVVAVSTQYALYPEVLIRSWALQDEDVKAVQERVDGRRLAYVEALFLEIDEDKQNAKVSAQMMYAILVGAEQMQPPLVGDDLRTLYDEYLKLIGLE